MIMAQLLPISVSLTEVLLSATMSEPCLKATRASLAISSPSIMAKNPDRLEIISDLAGSWATAFTMTSDTPLICFKHWIFELLTVQKPPIRAKALRVHVIF